MNAKFKEKKALNSSFSMRSWAKSIGINGHGSLQQILAGSRNLPKKYIPALVKSMMLSNEEGLYFETLVDIEKSKTKEEASIYEARLESIRLRNKNFNAHVVENYKYFDNPLHSILRTMTELKGFQSDFKGLADTIRLKTSQSEINEVVDRLVLLDLLGFDDNANPIKLTPHIRNKLDVPSEAVQKYHKKMSALAAQEISNQTVDEREYNSYCLNIQSEKIPLAKEKIRNFIKEFVNEFEADKNQALDTYCMNLQLFRVTK